MFIISSMILRKATFTLSLLCLVIFSFGQQIQSLRSDSTIDRYQLSKVGYDIHTGIRISPPSLIKGEETRGHVLSRSSLRPIYGTAFYFPLTLYQKYDIDVRMLLRFTSLASKTELVLPAEEFGLDQDFEAVFRESKFLFEPGIQLSYALNNRLKKGLELNVGIHMQMVDFQGGRTFGGELHKNGQVLETDVLQWSSETVTRVSPQPEFALGIGYRIPISGNKHFVVRMNRNFSKSNELVRELSVVNTSKGITGIQEIQKSYWALELAFLTF